jgi:hypothetical protein
MKTVPFFASVLFAFNSYAHIDQGVWNGTTKTGAPCFMTVGPQTFEGNMPHPLNERIAIKVGQAQFSVHHPAVIDAKTATASFNHDLFEGVLATQTGAMAVVIEMSHTPEFEGPTKFTGIENNWKTGQKNSYECSNLKLQN